MMIVQSIGSSVPRSSHTLHARCHRTKPCASAAPNISAAPTTVSLTTNADCELAVSIYPTFSYNAAGGGGMGTVTPPTTTGGTRQQVTFDASTLAIPPLDYRSTRLFGIPLPPPLKIEIIPKRLQGFVDTETGETSLSFDAEFCFSVGSLYKAPPLSVVTDLTSEESSGEIHTATGRRRSATDGSCRLVGVARVPKTTDGFLNTFLMLPTDALAVLSASISFSK